MKSMLNALGSYGAAALILLLLALPGSAFAIAGKFEFVNGQVQIIDASGARHTVNKGDVINQGDTISASANGFAQIKMEDGGFFAVRPDTQFKIDTFNFNGTEDGSEKGVFSLIKGSLRSVTGLIGKVHRDNYKILTATSTIGIRGSGADVGHSDDIGTAIHTLFGGHTLTSHGQTIETGPGQTALAAPGQAPRFVPSFPFNTSTSPNDKQASSAPGNDRGNNNKGSTTTNNNTANNGDPTSGTTTNNVVIPIITTDGTNLTNNTTSSGSPIIASSAGASYIHFTAGILDTGSGYVIAEDSSNKVTYPFSNYTFDSNGGLKSASNSSFTEYNSDEFNAHTEIVSDTPSSFVVTGGTESDIYHTPDNSLLIGRSSGTVVDITCGVCSGSDTFVSSVFILGLATPPSLVQTITGSTTYTLVGSTHPADGFGNVGTLNSAHLNANFTTQTVGLDANLSINNKTLTASASSLPIVADGFETSSPNVSCSGTGCGSPTAYVGDISGKFFGNGAATAGFEYLFWPSSNTSGNFTDIIQGVAAFSSGSAPSAIASDPAPVGSGGSVVGMSSTYASLFGSSNPYGSGSPLFGGANVVDNQKFSARLDANGDLIAFAVNNSSNGGSLSGGTTSAVTEDGSDTPLGVVWGRWNSGYVVNVKGNNNSATLAPTGNLAFITSTQATTSTQLAALPGLGVISASYSLTPGNFPTVFDGVSGSHVTSASANVNFSTNQITSFSVAGAGSGGYTWSAASTSSGSIANFMSGTGIPLSGSCMNGAGGCASAGGGLSGIATGGFVGAQAQGLASTIGLNGPGGTNIGAAVYMKR